MISRTLPKSAEDPVLRMMDILDLIYKFPDTMSDEEVQGAANMVNPDIRNTVLGLLEIESARSLEIQFIRRVIDVLREGQRAKEQGKKIVYIPFTFPPEILYSFEGIYPICTEIVAGLVVNVCAGQGEKYWDYALGLGIPDSLCSANTITAGILAMGHGLKPDAIVSNSPGSCNPNAKMHAFVADYLGVPQFILEKPVDESPRAREQYYRYLKGLIGQLEEFAGEEVSGERMREVLTKAERAAELYHEFWDLRKAKPCPVHNIFHPTFLVLRSQLWGRDEAVEIMQGIVDLSRERMRKGEYTAPEEVARIYVNYIFALFDFYGFFTWTEKKGITLLGDVLGIHFFPPIDKSSKESMIRGLSGVTFDYPMTRQMGASSISTVWLEDTCYAIKEFEADGCVYYGHHACKHTAGTLAYVTRETMKRTGVPTMALTVDAFDKRYTPMSMMQEEVERFVEKVLTKRVAQKKRRKKKAPS